MENLKQPDGFLNVETIQKTSTNYVKAQTSKLSYLESLDTGKALDDAIQSIVFLNNTLTGNEELDYLRASSAIHRLLEAILHEEKRVGKAAVRNRLAEVREIHRQSPFFVRTQDWPRGYAGDFETIEYIVKGENKSAKHSLGYYLEAIILNSPIVQQHRNKVQHQAQLILEKALDIKGAKVLSIGCGSSADLRSIQKVLKSTDIAVTLFDMDEGALSYSAEKLDQMRDQCNLIQGNLLRLVKKIEEKFDLIVIGGVFDYLNDKTITSLLDKIYNENLKPGGEIFFTNIASGNPYRAWMEYCFDWELIERSERNIRSIYDTASLANSSLAVMREETGLTFLAKIINNQ